MADGLIVAGKLDGCNNKLMIDTAAGSSIVLEAVAASGLTWCAEASYSFSTKDEQSGYSLTAILAESAINIHTWPESGRVDVICHVCHYMQNNEHKARAAMDYIRTAFDCDKYEIKEVEL